MPKVTLVSRPSGTHAEVVDPETGITFIPNVTVEVDDATAKRLKSVEQFGFTFYVGDPAALETVVSPDDVLDAPSVFIPTPDPEVPATADVPPASTVQ